MQRDNTSAMQTLIFDRDGNVGSDREFVSTIKQGLQSVLGIEGVDAFEASGTRRGMTTIMASADFPEPDQVAASNWSSGLSMNALYSDARGEKSLRARLAVNELLKDAVSQEVHLEWASLRSWLVGKDCKIWLQRAAEKLAGDWGQ